MKKLFVLMILSLGFSVTAQTELIHEVYFETDKFEVPSTEHNRLLLFLSDIESLDIEKITIYGFTDDRGSDSYNLILSQERANAIKTIFSNNEFDESIITNVDGKGKVLIKVVQEEDLNKIRGLNRKVEIIVHPFNPPREIKLPEKKDISDALLDENLKAGDKIRLENILFKTGYSILLPESKKTLEKMADVLVKRKDIYFTSKVMYVVHNTVEMLLIEKLNNEIYR